MLIFIIFLHMLLIASPLLLYSQENIHILSCYSKKTCYQQCLHTSNCTYWGYSAFGINETLLRTLSLEVSPEKLNNHPLCIHIDAASSPNISLHQHYHRLFATKNFSNTPFYHRMQHRDYDIQYLLTSPLIGYASTTMMYPTHFLRGCKYTIAFWTWLWRPLDLLYREQEYVLFNTRKLRTSSMTAGQEHVSPAIIWNAGNLLAQPGRQSSYSD
jgi:hypothetical protein